MALAPPTISAVAQSNPISGYPEIALTVTNTQIFNLVGEEDASFETGIGSATAITNCSVGQTRAAALDGAFSLAMTALANGAMVARVGPYPVSAGVTYSYAAAYLAAYASESVRTDIEWYNGASLVSTTTGTATTDNSVLPWEPQSSLPEATAPGGANLAYIVFNVLGATGPISSPGTVTVTPTGTTGTTPYHYEMTAVTPYGETPASPVGATTTGNANLSIGNYNVVSASAVSGASSYNFYRSAKLTCAGLPTLFATCSALAAGPSTCSAILTLPGVPVLIANSVAPSLHDTGLVLGTKIAPSVNTTAEVHYIDEVGLFPGAVESWGIFQTGVMTILRNDGEYVLGASPLFPLALPISNSDASIVDYTAPYGLPATYVATLISGGSTLSPLSVPSPPVLMGQAPDTLSIYNRLGWAKDQDIVANLSDAESATEAQIVAIRAAILQAEADSDVIDQSDVLIALQGALAAAEAIAAQIGPFGVLLRWLSGIGQMAQGLDNLFFDQIDAGGNYYPGPSQLLDINRCPTDMLTWLGQFVGVSVDPSLRDDQQRYSILQEAGFKRGTPGAIIATANKFLRPGASATIAERDSSPYHLTVTIPAAGTVGPGSCLSLLGTYATCAEVLADFATCADLWTSTVDVTAAVLAAIPAGLVCAVEYD